MIKKSEPTFEKEKSFNKFEYITRREGIVRNSFLCTYMIIAKFRQNENEPKFVEILFECNGK